MKSVSESKYYSIGQLNLVLPETSSTDEFTPIGGRVAELAQPILAKTCPELPRPLAVNEAEELRGFQANIGEEELRALRVFAAGQASWLIQPKYFNKKEMRALSPTLSHAVSLMPDGTLVIHLGKKGDRLFDPKKRGRWKTLTRGIGIEKNRVRLLAVLETKFSNKDRAHVNKILKEDARAHLYPSDYVIKSCAPVTMRDKEGIVKVYLFEPLADMDGRQFTDLHLPLKERLKVVRDAARGLQAIHAGGGIHRDVKLSNLLVDLHPNKREVRQARVADLGFCVDVQEVESAWARGTPLPVAGTADYLPKEVKYHVRPQCPSDDVYALGIVLRQLLKDGGGERSKAERPACEVLLERMLSVDPYGQERPSAQEVADSLDHILSDFQTCSAFRPRLPP